jgi:hypothetical protein
VSPAATASSSRAAAVSSGELFSKMRASAGAWAGLSQSPRSPGGAGATGLAGVDTPLVARWAGA